VHQQSAALAVAWRTAPQPRQVCRCSVWHLTALPDPAGRPMSLLRGMTKMCIIWRLLVSHSTRRWRSTLKWQQQSGLVIFIYSPCDSSGALCLVMSHRASLVPSLDRDWTTATLCITACQTRTSSCVATESVECCCTNCLPSSTTPSLSRASWSRISICYLCLAESTTRLPSSVIKPSYCNNLRVLLVYSRHTDSHMFDYVRPAVNTVFIGKHCCSSVLLLSALYAIVGHTVVSVKNCWS